ncbi:hypothetical protein WJX73_010218 [Symbiochloris irregularis]|uniref:Methyltransferase type 11 domain-containing protein n=1 Tax=Symbiochloris irregularis TaxID=706552 RepID=A0AAW1NXB2_9CHLO
MSNEAQGPQNAAERLTAAEKGILDSVKIAIRVLEELDKLDQCDLTLASASCEQFLTNLQEVGKQDQVNGYPNVTATDLSPAAIEGMQSRQQQDGKAPVRWQVADMLDLPFENASFDVVIEKAALDCLLTDCKSPWDLPEAAKRRVHVMLTEVHRVLTAEGMFLSITFAQPHFRRPLLLAKDLSWNMQHTAFNQDGGMHHHFYALQKGARSTKDVPTQLAGYSPESHAIAGGISQTQVDSEDFISLINV